VSWEYVGSGGGGGPAREDKGHRNRNRNRTFILKSRSFLRGAHSSDSSSNNKANSYTPETSDANHKGGLIHNGVRVSDGVLAGACTHHTMSNSCLGDMPFPVQRVLLWVNF
jgi:hypothetical protein